MSKSPTHAKWGTLGGNARRDKMTPAERSASARNAAQARWAKLTKEERQASTIPGRTAAIERAKNRREQTAPKALAAGAANG